MKYCAVGVVVAPTTPALLTESREFVIPVRVRTPALEKLDVAEPPKYAMSKTESRVDDALVAETRPVNVDAPVTPSVLPADTAPVKVAVVPTLKAPSVVMLVLIVVAA